MIVSFGTSCMITEGNAGLQIRLLIVSINRIFLSGFTESPLAILPCNLEEFLGNIIQRMRAELTAELISTPFFLHETVVRKSA